MAKQTKSKSRDQQIVTVSLYGIGVNLLLVSFKAAIGWLAGSVSIIIDAVNNLSDALSSIITIVGTKLANRRPDERHPFGYGRIEYLSSVVVVVIVLLAGITALKESALKIFSGEPPQFTAISLVILAVGILVKFFFGRFVSRRGKQLKSDALVASGEDAVNDAFLSIGTLISASVSYFMGYNIEGIVGVIISVMIVRAGWEMLNETLDKLLGTRTEAELTAKIKKEIAAHKQVQGVYDLTLHNYGPTKIIATAHIQVPDKMTAQQIHHLTRHIETDIYHECGIIMTIGIYASNDHGVAAKIKAYLEELLADYPSVLQMHGFYVDEQTAHVFFDLIFSFAEEKPERIIHELTKKLQQKYPDYEYDVIVDTDYSEEMSTGGSA